MQRMSVFFTAIIFGAAAWAQEPLLEEELFEDELPEIRRYSVEVIVFAYSEEVSVGTEVFVPEVGEYPSFELLDFPGGVVGMVLNGVVTSFDAGATWTFASGLTQTKNKARDAEADD